MINKEIRERAVEEVWDGKEGKCDVYAVLFQGCEFDTLKYTHEASFDIVK
jgi:hypothetical protein